MKFRWLKWTIPALVLVLNGCGKKEHDIEVPVLDLTGDLRMQIEPMYGAEAFVIGEEYTDAYGRDFRLENVRFYVSAITLIRDDGTEHEVQDVALFDLDGTVPVNPNTPKWYPYVDLKAPFGTYTGIRFDVGVSETLNASNPADFANEHPLSTYALMHWDWNSKYIFVKTDGRLKSDGSSTIDHTFQYHVGFDKYRMDDIALDANFSVEPDEANELSIGLNLERAFINDSDTINLFDGSGTHTFSNEALAERFINNFVSGFFVPAP